MWHLRNLELLSLVLYYSCDFWIQRFLLSLEFNFVSCIYKSNLEVCQWRSRVLASTNLAINQVSRCFDGDLWIIYVSEGFLLRSLIVLLCSDSEGCCWWWWQCTVHFHSQSPRVVEFVGSIIYFSIHWTLYHLCVGFRTVVSIWAIKIFLFYIEFLIKINKYWVLCDPCSFWIHRPCHGLTTNVWQWTRVTVIMVY